ncbi:MAG: hypothetical protein VXZ82_11925 [Planctomycetota bacterium]|nr:hypothetical protein [Planctomycetota bacterium]
MDEADIASYRGLHDLPVLAGLCSMQDATQPEWSVEESVEWLKYLHFVGRSTLESIVARIPSQPIYELKMLFSHHAYLLGEHVDSLRKRVAEMRQPPLGLEQLPHPSLKILREEIDACPADTEFVLAIYEVIVPSLLDYCSEFVERAHPLADAPSRRVVKWMMHELEEVGEVGEEVVSSIRSKELDLDQVQGLQVWLDGLVRCLQIAEPSDAARQADASETERPELELPPMRFSNETPAKFDTRPQRDERFCDPYNAGVNPEAFLYDERFLPRDKSLMMYYKRLREIDVPEMMASILVELRCEEPWEFYFEMLRQLWDEARHAMMGEVGFVSLGIDWTQIPINFTWSLNLNSQLSAHERHGVLFFIEQGLMPKTGKRFEWEIGRESGDGLSALFQDFDWADEVLHAQIGRRWYVPKFESLKAALDYGDRCWSQVLSHFDAYAKEGLTKHRNWWPEIYCRACERWDVEPDAAALEFDVSYQEKRADLRDITKD